MLAGGVVSIQWRAEWGTPFPGGTPTHTTASHSSLHTRTPWQPAGIVGIITSLAGLITEYCLCLSMLDVGLVS